MPPAMPADVKTVIDAYPAPARAGVLALRGLIFEVADGLETCGQVEETLKWGQPAYLCRRGSTLRLGLHKDAQFALFAHCRSTIIHDYAQAFPGAERIDGNRAVLFDSADQIVPERLSHLIRHALTYHRRG